MLELGRKSFFSPKSRFNVMVAQRVKNSPACRRSGFNTWVQKIPWRKEWQPTPVFLPGETPWSEQPGGLQSMESQRFWNNLVTMTFTFFLHLVLGCWYRVGLPRWLSGRVCLLTQEMWVLSLGWKDSLEEEMTTQSSILAWETPWTEEPGGL